MHNLFFELIRFSIGTQSSLSRMPSAKEWEQLYAMAQKQSLIGICFAGVKKLCNFEEEYYAGMNEMLYLTWMGMAAKIQQRNEVVNRQCVELQKRLAADGLRLCILKGQGVAQLYGSLAFLRQSGDIDVWVDADAKTTIKYVKAITPTSEIERKHIRLNIFDDTDIEAHWIPSELDNPFRNRKLKAWYNAQRDNCFSNKVCLVSISGWKNANSTSIHVPTIEFNLVYLLLHIYEHFLYEGIGLRQIMDYYWTISNSTLMDEDVIPILQKLRLMKFAGAVMYVMREVFGMEEDQMLCEADEVFGKRLLDEILVGGNFGKFGKDGHHKDESKGEWAVRRLGRTLRLFRYDPIGAMCRPIIRLRLALWYKKMNNN